MPRDPDHSASGLENDNTGGLMTGFLAEEEEFDRRALWRVGSWGAASVGAVIVALLANQSSSGLRREQVAASDLVRQSQQIQSIAKESQLEARRLASAIDTLNSDRDRLYSRVTVLEQGLDSMTGTIARQTAAVPAPAASTSAAPIVTPVATQTPSPPPVVSPVTTTAATPATPAEKPRVEAAAPPPAPATVASVGQSAPQSTPQGPSQSAPQSPPPSASQSSSQEKSNAAAPTPVTPFVTAKSMLAPPDSTATKLIEPENPAKLPTAPAKAETVATVVPADDAEPDEAEAAPPKVAVQRTEFGVDVGGANSVGGLRALWRGLLKSRSNAVLTALRPIIVIKEGATGLGMQLRLVAGPLIDAAAAAKICAGLIENQRPCETTVFDGQRLAMNDPADAAAKASMAKPELVKSDASQPVAAKPVAAKPVYHRRSGAKRAANDEAAKKPDSPSTFSSLFSRH
jgi:hypothetical protein